MAEVVRNDKESFDALLRRFHRAVLSQGIINTVKGRQFHQNKPNRQTRRKSAIRKSKRRQQMQNSGLY